MHCNVIKLILLLLVLKNIKISATQKTQNKNVINNENESPLVKQNSIVNAFVELARHKNVSPKCRQQLKEIQIGISNQEVWAMKVHDAMGVKVPGFLLGQNYWLGSRETCEAASQPIKLLIAQEFEREHYFGFINETSPFEIVYKIVHLSHNSKWQFEWKFLFNENVIAYGLCVPENCKNDDVASLMQSYIKSDFFQENTFYAMKLKLLAVKDLKFKWNFFKQVSVIILCSVLIFTLFMMSSAFMLNLCVKLKEFKFWLFAFIQCFNVIENFSKIFFINEKKQKDIPVITGLRVINANIIVINHFVFFAYFAVNNKTSLLFILSRFLTLEFNLLVENFFIFSGFLQTYNFLQNKIEQEIIKNASLLECLKIFMKKIFYRWLRLAPPYYMIVVINAAVYSFLNDVSVFELGFRDDLLTKQYWWYYLLFIQNFLELKSCATSWTWSMACEMQFFIITTVLLIVYGKHRKLSYVLFSFLFMTSICYTVYNGVASKFLLNYDVVAATASQMYFNTIVRSLPYLMGILLAWYLVTKTQISYNLWERLIGNVSLLVLFIYISPICNQYIETYEVSAFSLVFTRLLFALFISGLILASIADQETWLTKILELKWFQPIGRISFAIYLINPVVITLFTGLAYSSLHYDLIFFSILSLGYIMVICCLATIYSLAFELPYCNLLKILRARRSNSVEELKN